MSEQQPQDWSQLMEQMNEAVADSIERNVEAQTAMMESWTGAFDGSTLSEEEMTEGIEGYRQAYEVWMDTAEEMVERTGDAAEGEDVDAEEFRDLWLQSANESFKEIMSTSAFAAANGELVEILMEAQQEVDDMTQENLAQFGMATRDDVVEVGERLVELERRQHAVEQKLDRIIEELE
ncbi:poly(R)-hydroxyalkanoic acid synthase subunit PhaE [Halovenus salina]|uniref:Poly(3-hydroxyalkanoate) polymerase subunit PhaE n=1 Tax=Halovenus salina TaxID=1510225 RepID=A0ABD5W549_9EURY|nr:poly(R)-hydroxyalkanoic acid synthase subunit PhaE [Halovenus salina]